MTFSSVSMAPSVAQRHGGLHHAHSTTMMGLLDSEDMVVELAWVMGWFIASTRE
jgi:hypothetical protein